MASALVSPALHPIFPELRALVPALLGFMDLPSIPRLMGPCLAAMCVPQGIFRCLEMAMFVLAFLALARSMPEATPPVNVAQVFTLQRCSMLRATTQAVCLAHLAPGQAVVEHALQWHAPRFLGIRV
jgi:hypothetical protein